MKKLIIGALMLAASTASFAQKEGSFLSFGIKAGFNSTKFEMSKLGTYPKDEWKTEAKNGFIYGAFARVKLSHPLYLQPEIYFSEKKFGIGNSSISAKTFEVPILANLRLITLGPVRVHALAGPVVSIVRKDKVGEHLSDYVDFNKNTWTFQAGGGIEVLGVGIDARYEWGLNNATKGIGGKTDVLTITAGIRLFGH